MIGRVAHPDEGANGDPRPQSYTPAYHNGEHLMQIAAHVSFYYNETRRDRLRYLTQVLKHLDAIGTTHDLTVIIYCNQEFSVDSNFPHIRIQTIVVKFFDRFFPRRLRRDLPQSVRRLVDPKYLTCA